MTEHLKAAMRPVYMALVLLMTGISCLAALTTPVTAAELRGFKWEATPEPLPDIALLRPDGSEMRLQSLKGKVLIVNFWATWCPPCIEELPTLEALQKAMAGPDFAVVLVSEDRNGLKVADPFLKDRGFNELSTLIDPKSALARALGLQGLPVTLLVDREGRVLGSLTGAADWNSEAARKLIEQALAKAST